jgi:serine/threonine protein kinase
VFRAHDPIGDRPVAVKLFTLDLSPERVQQFVVELQHLIGANLAHPGLAVPIAAGMHGVSAYLAQELVAADSLDLVIREYGAAPPNDALRVVAQLAGALDFANAAKVRHGALHPRDVLLSSDETRLTGLGVAHALERVGIGAPVRRPYTPPERIAAGEWDRRSDVFSLAALAHELLWARRVSGAGSRAGENLTPIPGADLDALRSVFARALAEDPSERFETALEFADVLRGGFAAGAGASQSAAGSPQSSVDSPDQAVVDEFVVASQEPLGIQHISDEVPEGATMFPQAPEKPKAAETRPPADVRRPAPPPSPPTPSTPTLDRRPATAAPRPTTGDRKAPADPGLPLLDRHADVDLPIAEISQAEEDRYWDVEVAPAIVPQAKERPAGGSGQDAVGSSRYLDYVREDQAAPPTPDLPVAPPIVMRPTLPEPTAIHEPKRSVGVPVLLALAVGLMLGFGAGYGVGLRQGTPPAADSSSTDGTPPPAGREFTESPVPDAPMPAATAGEPPALASGTDAPPPAPSSAPPSAAPTVAPPAAAAAAATPPPEPDGRLLVRTTPAGARVIVDGREYGVTPFAVRNLAPGGHRVRVVREGYTAQERRVVLTASQPSQSLTIDLERQGGSAAVRGAQAARTAATGSSGRFTGDLSVASNPPGATVFMDGKQVGTTPLTLRAVPAGSHAIRLEYDGYRRWSSAVRVVASQQNRIAASLER